MSDLKFNINLLSTFIIFFFSATILGGQSGYILNGKIIVTHKDGIPVNEEKMEEKSKEGSKAQSDSFIKASRQPASIKMNGFLQFEEDEFVRCYWHTSKDALQCIKK